MLELLRKGDIEKRVKAIQETQKHLGFEQIGSRRVRFKPAEPMDYEGDLGDMYELPERFS